MDGVVCKPYNYKRHNLYYQHTDAKEHILKLIKTSLEIVPKGTIDNKPWWLTQQKLKGHYLSWLCTLQGYKMLQTKAY